MSAPRVAPAAGKKSVFEAKKTADVPLLKLESGKMFLLGEGITTVQFFEGDAVAAAVFLKERLAQVIEASPWIGGVLVKNASMHGKLAAIRYSKNLDKIRYSKNIDALFDVDETLQLSEDMPYKALAKAVTRSRAHVPRGVKLLNKPLPFTRLTVVPRASGGGFAVIFSMSHVVADGATYYTVLGMLSAEGAVQPVDAARKQAAQDAVPGQVGPRFQARLLGVPVALNGIGEMLWGKRARMHCLLVDGERLGVAKAAAKAAAPEVPGHISTNDVLTSGFGRLVKARLLLMAIDFRNRIDGLTFGDAGNYHSGLLFDAAAYSHPSTIRAALTGPPPLSRAALPGTLAQVRCRMAMITNWASMSKGELALPGCKQTLHVPCVNAAELSWDSAIVFKPRPAEVAVLAFLKRRSAEELRAELPLGAPVNEKMFADR